ncbi:MAG: ATP-binding cassette domain-containing protein [Prevotella sp.]|nr:ATP-binding cassette domain-containing protein [Prevotella sp.]
MNLIASHIVKSFGNNKILADVSFEILPGNVVVLMGTNGAGKTTLFNIFSGFLKPDSGQILLDGRDVSGFEPSTIARAGVGRTFQDMRLIEEMTVFENVLLSFPGQEGEKWWNTLFPLPKVVAEQKSNAEKTKQILHDCFIEDVADYKAKDISYGQQKLLNMACCMASNASVWLLDEPVAGVNPVYREKLSEVIRQQKSTGKSILLIEHNSDFIEAVADEILFLNKGIISRFSSYESFRQDADVKNAYV